MSLLIQISLLLFTVVAHAGEISPNCIKGSSTKSKRVTYYIVPLLEKYDHFQCDQMQGTCIYGPVGQQMIHNFGHKDEPLANARCKNGWGNKSNCLHPCRTLAASMQFHQHGQIVFMKELVGLKCGNQARDGYEFVHDGYMIVGDTGSPTYFNAPGRFDFFGGRCILAKNGLCYEGVASLAENTTNSDYCTVWDPRNPMVNKGIKDSFVRQVQMEDRARGDLGAAEDLNKL